jgi:D-arabinose 1-dehydrogenase-like Zn-dependent alcohol dehydrogenase
MKAIKFEGIMSVVGAVAETGAASVPTVLDCWLNNFVARGIAVGSRAMMEEMVAAVESNDIHPVLDSNTFSLQEAKEAFVHFVSQTPFSWHSTG